MKLKIFRQLISHKIVFNKKVHDEFIFVTADNFFMKKI